MKNLSLRIWIVLAMLALAPGALIAQTAGQGIMFGTWKLNVDKSDFGAGFKLMAMSIKVTSDTPELIQFSVEETTGNGFNVSYSFKGAADGKDYPIIGSSSIYSYTEEPGVVHETQKDTDGTITKGDFTVTEITTPAPKSPTTTKGVKAVVRPGVKSTVGTWLYTITNPDGSVVKQKLVFDLAA
jgi:hypothetical protein